MQVRERELFASPPELDRTDHKLRVRERTINTETRAFRERNT